MVGLNFCLCNQTDDNKNEISLLNKKADKGEINDDQYHSKLAELGGTTKKNVHDLVAGNYHSNEEEFSLASSLKHKGYKLGVISNVGHLLSVYLPNQDFSKFDEITLSFQVGSVKPDQAIYLYHLRKLNVKPEELIFIDDREVNCIAACQLGIKGILYKDITQLKRDIAHILQ